MFLENGEIILQAEKRSGKIVFFGETAVVECPLIRRGNTAPDSENEL
jgi:hypothetical protein